MAARRQAPSSSEEGVGGGGVSRETLLKRAAEMRRNPTEPEKKLWSQLRSSRLGGHKFRRQAVLGYRIADFFCPAKGLVIEVDGDTHDREADLVKDEALRQEFGFATFRFTNEELMRNPEGVTMMISNWLGERDDRWRGRNHPPTPSFEKEGEV